MSTNEHESLKTETFVLKVHINCQGCRTKVRKALRKIEGVYEVDINAENQKVAVTGVVNPSTLVQKLAKLGKHAEILNEDYNQEHTDDDDDDINDNSHEYITNYQSAFENQYMIPSFYDKDSYGPDWFYNHNINQHLAAQTPLSYETFDNVANANVTRINEYPKWKRPESFEESIYGTNYSGLGNQGWPYDFLGPSSVMDNMHGYYHGYHPSN